MATVTAAAAFNSLAESFSEARFRRRLRKQTATPAPVFIIGHWRSGTTLLHEMLMHDDSFCCPTTYQCFAPGHFLLTDPLLPSILQWLIPSKRPMDDVATGWSRPQEDEFALANMGAPSPYRRMAFPNSSSNQPEPRPRFSRPAVMWSSVAAIFASTQGLR